MIPEVAAPAARDVVAAGERSRSNQDRLKKGDLTGAPFLASVLDGAFLCARCANEVTNRYVLRMGIA